VSIPTYDRWALRRGVVHISVGSFHRSHQAVYFDDLARQGLADGWALTGVGLHRRAMKEALAAQDGLYTVVERDSDGDRARVVGVITRYLFAAEETAAVIGALADPSTRLVTLTITAQGYRADPRDPSSAVGLLVAGLERRRRAGQRPFTVLSCDNVPGNGPLTRDAVVSGAALHDPALARWIDEHGAFPSSMVDRITPSTSDDDRRMVERTFGVRDRWPVMTEPFSQWVVEDAFCDGRPPLDAVGVQFVDDVRPYALLKTRLLNAAHCALGYLGSLAGHVHVHDAIGDELLGAYAAHLMDAEIAPLLPPADTDLAAYAATLRGRLANAAVGDRLERLCRNGSAKVPAHLLSSIRDARAAGRPHPLLTLAVAAWCRYLRGTAQDGRPLVLDDPHAARLQALARAGGDDPRLLLADEATFGSLGRCPRFRQAVAHDLRLMAAGGVRSAVAHRIPHDLEIATA